MVLDILVILTLCVFSLIGYKKGMLVTLFSIVTFILAIYLSYLLVPVVYNLINSIIPLQNLSLGWINKDVLANFMNQNSKFAIIIKFLLHSGNNSIASNIIEIVFNALLFILLSILLRHFIKAIMNKIANMLKGFFIVGTFDRMCGLLFGFLKGMLLSCIICFVVLSVYDLNLFNGIINNQINTSTLVSFFANGTDYLIYTFGGSLYNTPC